MRAAALVTATPVVVTVGTKSRGQERCRHTASRSPLKGKPPSEPNLAPVDVQSAIRIRAVKAVSDWSAPSEIAVSAQ